MTTAQQILDERFAKGEITDVQYTDLSSRLSATAGVAQGRSGQLPPGQIPQGQMPPGQMPPAQVPPVPVYPGQISQARPSSNVWPWVGAGIGLLVLVGIWLGYAAENRLVLGHLEVTERGYVDFRLSNPSSNTGDVLIYVMEKGHRRCEHVTDMKAGEAKAIRIACVINTPEVEVNAEWALNSSIVGIATRI